MDKQKELLIKESECSILGFLLSFPELSDKYSYLLIPEDFNDNLNKNIFATWKKVVENSQNILDTETLIFEIKKSKEFQNYDLFALDEYLRNLTISAPTVTQFIKCIEFINEENKKNSILKVINNIKEKIENSSMDSFDALDNLEKNILDIVKPSGFKEFKEIKDLSKEVLDKIFYLMSNPTSADGINTSFRELDAITSGLHKDELIILAARPSMGKTAFALNLALNAAKNTNGTVMIFSLEMNAEQLVTRMLSCVSNVDGYLLKKPSLLREYDVEKMVIGQNKLKNLKIIIDDSPGLTIGELVWKANNAKKNMKDLALIVVDYLQLLSVSSKPGSGNNRQNEISKISRDLKRLSRDAGVPVLALSQLSRKVEERESKIPLLSDLRESGSIEQDADIVSFLYRPEYYKNSTNQSDVQDVHVIISKNRNGATGRFILTFEPKIGLFSNSDKKSNKIEEDD